MRHNESTKATLNTSPYLTEYRSPNGTDTPIKKDRINIIEYSRTGDFWQCVFKSIPYIVHLHGSGFSYKNYLGNKMSNGEKLMNKFEGMFYKYSKHIFAPSKWILNQTEMEIRTKFKCNSLLKYPITNTLIIKKEIIIIIKFFFLWQQGMIQLRVGEY